MVFLIHFSEGEPWKTQAWNTLRYLCKRVFESTYDRIQAEVIFCVRGLALDWFSQEREMFGHLCGLHIFVVCTLVMFCLCSEMIMKWSSHDPSQPQSDLLWYWHSAKSFVSNRTLVPVPWCWLFVFFSYHTHYQLLRNPAECFHQSILEVIQNK